MRRMVICIFILVWPLMAKAHGKDAMEYFNLGLESGMTNKKIEYYTKALNLNPKLAAAYEKRGMLYYYLEKYDKMIQDFQSYIELVPAKAEAYRILGVGYLKNRLFKAAISSLTRAIEMDSNLASAYTNRAEAYLLSGKYEEAILDSTQAIKIWGDPRTMSDAYRTRAKVYWKIDRNTEAYADNRTSLRLDPRVPKFWTTFPPMEDVRGMGLLYLIGIAFILIFKIRLKPPEKDD